MISAIYITPDGEVNPAHAKQLASPHMMTIKAVHPAELFAAKGPLVLCDLDRITGADDRRLVLAWLTRITDQSLVFVHTRDTDGPDASLLKTHGCVVRRELDEELIAAMARAAAA